MPIQPGKWRIEWPQGQVDVEADMPLLWVLRDGEAYLQLFRNYDLPGSIY